ncbi:MAG TPA: hypothetical protein VHT52_19400, partial [Stellaceae bacterium]|nr:hypothetical protein [Stellaceae bacterium]
MTSETNSATPKPPDLQTEFVARGAWKAGVMGSLNVLFVILAVRAVLFLAVIGAIVLARAALAAAPAVQQPALVLLAVYCVTVVCPIVWLSSR